MAINPSDDPSPYGTIVEANLMMDRATGRPRGFGFVSMSTAEEAQKAIEGLHGKQVDGRALTVNVARPREERTGGGGGGGGRREFRGGGGGGRRGDRYARSVVIFPEARQSPGLACFETPGCVWGHF